MLRLRIIAARFKAAQFRDHISQRDSVVPASRDLYFRGAATSSGSIDPATPATAAAAAAAGAASSVGSVSGASMVTTRAASAPLAEEFRLERIVSNLQASCSALPEALPVSGKHAAVLVPLFEDPATGEVHVVLNQRSSKLKSHSGEVCLPGGKRDPADSDDIATALREAQEELGLDPACVCVVACLPPFLSKHLLSVTPVVGVIPAHLRFTPNPTEVEAVFTAPLKRFLEAGPTYSSRDVEWEPGVPYRLHYFQHTADSGATYCIWGLTAGMLIVIAEAAFKKVPDFQQTPPNTQPYTDLCWNGKALSFRTAGTADVQADALHLAAEAASEESPRSAATAGAVITDGEAAAALGTAERCGSLILVAEPFGFSEDGRMNITISNFKLWSPGNVKKKGPFNRVGFFITTPAAEGQLELDLAERKCPLDSQDIAITLFTFDAIDPKTSKVSREFRLFDMLQDFHGGEFSLFFANCEPDSAIDFTLGVSLYNVRGNRNDYLPVGEDMLPFIYFSMFIAFTVLGVLWTLMVIRGKADSHKIHYLMIVLVAFKSLTVLSQAFMFHTISLYGDAEGWNIAFYVFTACRSFLFFLVVILLATGWSYMKPFIALREKRLLMVVVPLQIIANIAIIYVDEFTPAAESWFTWRDILHLVDIVCCCLVLFPIVWSIKQLRDASETDGKVVRTLVKLTLFRQFYIMVVCYIYFTRIIVYLLESTLPYHYIWLAAASSEFATLAFYVAAGVSFRPMPAGANPYFQLTEEEAIELTKAEQEENP
ncbi:hypothetical protein ACK3TF_000346 [Chlorella vulgaris]